VLGASGIPVREADVGGLRGRKVQFVTGTGTVWVKEL
jgi:chemotaxis receptor (MCP) glutamine deamidase CheD